MPAAAEPKAAAPPPTLDPVYRIDMPVLTFGSDSPTPPADPDPQTIVLVREARVDSGVTFQGHVTAQVTPSTPKQTAGSSAQAANRTPQPKQNKRPNILSRIFRLFGGHKTPNP
jgi:hypothetical protein